MNSRRKGKAGELEFAGLCKAHGYDCRRGQQYSGANGDADVEGLPGIHIEVKRVERLDLEGAMSQSVRDARVGELPIVAHRKNRGEWLITMRADDWFALCGQMTGLRYTGGWKGGCNHADTRRTCPADGSVPGRSE